VITASRQFVHVASFGVPEFMKQLLRLGKKVALDRFLAFSYQPSMYALEL